MFDFAVVVPTVLRPTLLQAARSVVDQEVAGSINLLIGVDFPEGGLDLLDDIKSLERQSRKITVINLGYSTSVARGGTSRSPYGGWIRTICSFAANSRYIAYLDDDNWYAPDHLESLAQAITGKAWAFSRRVYVDEATRQPLGEDRWESVGPGRGVDVERFGGFCDTSTLLLDAEKNIDVFHLWSFPWFKNGSGTDRRVFEALRHRPYGDSRKPTVFYTIHPYDVRHEGRLQFLRQVGEKVPK